MAITYPSSFQYLFVHKDLANTTAPVELQEKLMEYTNLGYFLVGYCSWGTKVYHTFARPNTGEAILPYTIAQMIAQGQEALDVKVLTMDLADSASRKDVKEAIVAYGELGYFLMNQVAANGKIHYMMYQIDPTLPV